MVIGMKTGYGIAGNDRNTVGLSYRPFLNWAGKSSNFPDLLYCSSGLYRSVYLIWAGAAIFFLLIQRVFKYLNDLNL
jgi:hypothetical protein